MEIKISEKALEQAVKRHEDAWEEELKNVDVKAVVLKTKKAVLEQSLINARCQNAAIDQEYRIRSLKSDVARFQSSVDRLTKMVEENSKVFKQAIEILQHHEKEHKKDKEERKGFFKKFWEFLKCLTS
jgi:ribosomal protein S15P/S13E